jgi:hypothetical protein
MAPVSSLQYSTIGDEGVDDAFDAIAADHIS